MKRSGWLWLSPPSVAVSSAKNSPITRGLRPAHRQLYKYTLSQTSNISSLQSTIDSIQDISTVDLQLNTEDVRSYILAFYRLCVQSEEGLDPWPIFETSYFLSIWAIVDTKFDKSEHSAEMFLWVSPDWQRATLARKLQRFSFSSNTVPGEQLRTVAIQEPDLAPAWHDTHLQNIFNALTKYFFCHPTHRSQSVGWAAASEPFLAALSQMRTRSCGLLTTWPSPRSMSSLGFSRSGMLRSFSMSMSISISGLGGSGPGP